MFELFWGILNLILLISLVIFLLKILKVIRKDLGLFASIFLGGILLMSLGTDSKEKNINYFDIGNKETTFIENSKFHRINVANNEINKTSIGILLSETHDLKKVNLDRSGLIACTSLTPIHFNLENLSDKEIKFNARYYKDWYLLGIKIYSQIQYVKGSHIF